MLELYHHGSSACAAKVRFALAEKGLEWRSHYLDILKGDQFDPAYLKINPKAVVPTLVHDGRVIPESTVICEYVEETFPGHKIYPETAYERAHVRVWTKAVDEELHPACSAITYIVSHRHTILRQGTGNFDEFLQRGAAEGTAARTLKWQWIQQGIEGPGAADKMRLYDGYLHKMEAALGGREWLVGDRFSMADIAMTPYVNRLDALAMDGLWTGGRLPQVERWFHQVRARPSFKPAFVDWMPQALAEEMRENGQKTWPQIRAFFGL
ncbi:MULTISPECIES: glutathione S-transferase family protein [unclassified Beijerinckia]|uniref:glutathione S-transferase family protein n=1 Tax=unclassified Beijerinckia TaxID=2638183 RepID=UPI00089D72B5|nr:MULTISPECIES: glutathione S-transferase family protein [unclassified Beijerinckia]MDH7796508.1 glutathione S-transferase [Beijerinckia sp. GAS462]SEC48109.1 glutathione S-transferase [Beijerinckia sp. 28-YEA-48]